MRSRWLVLMLLAAIPAATSDTAQAQAPKPRVVQLTADDTMKFNITTIDAKPGEQLTVVLRVVGQQPKALMAHNFVLLQLKTDLDQFVMLAAMARATAHIPAKLKGSIIAHTDLAGAGETVSVTFTVPRQPGSYPYLCSFPGHYVAGAKGMLNVKG